jgi:hypothetical protein
MLHARPFGSCENQALAILEARAMSYFARIHALIGRFDR